MARCEFCALHYPDPEHKLSMNIEKHLKWELSREEVMKKGLTDITLIVDRSGSMQPIAEESRNGILKFIKDQKEVPGDAVLSLVQFDHEIINAFTERPLGLVEDKDIQLIPRGTTALRDAIGYTIDGTGRRIKATEERFRPDRVVICIITDGYENSSQKYDMGTITRMITHQTDVYKWDFIYLGANQDAIATAGGYGIGANAALTYTAGTIGVRASYAAASATLKSARTTGQSVAEVGFTASQRSNAMGDQDPGPDWEITNGVLTPKKKERTAK